MNPRKTPKENQYQTILDSIADGVFTVDLDFHITSFNRAAEEITGFSRETAIGHACSDIFKADVCSDACILKQALKEQKAIVHRPVHIMRTDQKRIPISVNATLLRNKAGDVIGGVETFRDLTSVQKLQKALRRQHSFNDIVSKNEKMNKIFSILPRIAESNSTVLIGGQSGTGKELIARAIHNHSPQKNGPFVTVNCGALPDTLCESELFGYKAGAFTDAKRDKLGRFALAQNGSIFLDEIGDISPAVQIRLLRVLENRVYEPLGSTKTIETNARVIAATHRNLGELVKQGTFREDLYFRINVIRLLLPTLAERKSDIPLLIDHFIDRFNHILGRKILGITQEAIAAMLMYPWPGNVRELENAIEHAFALCQENLIQVAHLPEDIIPGNGSILVTTGLTLKEVEKQTIEQALKRNAWKRVKTARELGINKNTLRYKIQRYGINTEK
jgi:PAS domain S-box-containing protein